MMIDEDKQVLFMGITGSHAYGLARPDSDVDVRGVVLSSVEDTVGLWPFTQVEGQEVEVCLNGRNVTTKDTVFYGFQRYVNLVLQANPNLLELLFLPKRCVVAESWQWGRVIAGREWFLTKRIKNSYGGFAVSEVRRIDNQYAKDGTLRGKMAMHALRLLRQGRELLDTGRTEVDRSVAGDAEELLRVARGEVPYLEIMNQIGHETALLDVAARDSDLPADTDTFKINRMLTGIMAGHCASYVRSGVGARSEFEFCDSDGCANEVHCTSF